MNGPMPQLDYAATKTGCTYCKARKGTPCTDDGKTPRFRSHFAREVDAAKAR